jgi:hypothetical protein
VTTAERNSSALPSLQTAAASAAGATSASSTVESTSSVVFTMTDETSAYGASSIQPASSYPMTTAADKFITALLSATSLYAGATLTNNPAVLASLEESSASLTTVGATAASATSSRHALKSVSLRTPLPQLMSNHIKTDEQFSNIATVETTVKLSVTELHLEFINATSAAVTSAKDNETIVLSTDRATASLSYRNDQQTTSDFLNIDAESIPHSERHVTVIVLCSVIAAAIVSAAVVFSVLAIRRLTYDVTDSRRDSLSKLWTKFRQPV